MDSQFTASNLTCIVIPDKISSGESEADEISRGTMDSSIDSEDTLSDRMIQPSDLLDNQDFLHLPLQNHIYEVCKTHDTVLFHRPGYEKHFLLLKLMRYFAPKTTPKRQDSRYFPLSRRRQIFIVFKSLQSIREYYSVLSTHTNLRLCKYLETDQVSVKKAIILLATGKEDVHLMLDSVFENLVDEKLVQSKDIELLVLDDVHKILATKAGNSDSYDRIVAKLQPMSDDEQCLFRIIGFSASIFHEGFEAAVFTQAFERIKRGFPYFHFETEAHLRMISKYSVPCRIRALLYPNYKPSGGTYSEVFFRQAMHLLRNMVTSFYYSLATMPPIEKEKDQPISYEMLMRIIFDVLYIYGSLGDWCALHFIDLVLFEIQQTFKFCKLQKSVYLEKLCDFGKLLENIKQTILWHLPDGLSAKLKEELENSNNRNLLPHSIGLSMQEFLSISSPKLHLLARVINDYLRDISASLNQPKSNQNVASQFKASICVLLHVQNRSAARMVSMWLQELAYICCEDGEMQQQYSCLSYLQPDYAFLHDDIQAMEKSQIESDPLLKTLNKNRYYGKQEEALESFRSGCKNLLVTNSMVANGLDVRRCNLVIAFDAPKTFEQFIQAKGRMRVEDGQFIVLVPNKNEFSLEKARQVIRKLENFRMIENIFAQFTHTDVDVEVDMNTNWKAFSFEELSRMPEERAEVVSKLITPVLGGETVMLENAISILNRYYHQLPSDMFTNNKLDYELDLLKSLEYQCCIYLPSKSPFRDKIIGNPSSSRNKAIKSAAYKAVLKLQDLKELDENYYPASNETIGFIETMELVNSRTSLVGDGNGSKKVADAFRGTCFNKSYETGLILVRHLYEFEIKYTRKEFKRNLYPKVYKLGIIAPKNLDQIGEFLLPRQSYEIKIKLKRIIELEEQIEVSTKQVELAEKFHRFIFEEVLHLTDNNDIEFLPEFSSNGNLIVVPIYDGQVGRSIDWKLIESIVNYKTRLSPHEQFAFEEFRVKNNISPELGNANPLPKTFRLEMTYLPEMFYKMNLMLLAEELRVMVARGAGFGQVEIKRDSCELVMKFAHFEPLCVNELETKSLFERYRLCQEIYENDKFYSDFESDSNHNEEEGFIYEDDGGVKKFARKLRKKLKKAIKEAKKELKDRNDMKKNDREDTIEKSKKSILYDCFKYELLFDMNKFKQYLVINEPFYQEIVREDKNLKKKKQSKRYGFEKISIREKSEVRQALASIKADLKCLGINEKNTLLPFCKKIEQPSNEALKDLRIQGKSLVQVLFELFPRNLLLSSAPLMDLVGESEKKFEDKDDKSKAESESIPELTTHWYTDALQSDEDKFSELLTQKVTQKETQSTGASNNPPVEEIKIPGTSNDSLVEETQSTDISFDQDDSYAEQTRIDYPQKMLMDGRLLGPSMNSILQTLTDTTIKKRFELLGESFLTHSMTVYLYASCPDMNKDKLHYLRNLQISDINLYRLGKSNKLDCLMNYSELSLNWCPPGFLNPDGTTGSISRSLELEMMMAKSVKALIGVYLMSTGHAGAIKFMDWFGLKIIPKDLHEHPVSSSYSAKIDLSTSIVSSVPWLALRSPMISQSTPQTLISNLEAAFNARDGLYTRHRLASFEQQLGYIFNNKVYLIQALTHTSYNENKITSCYHRLECVGEVMLDYLITRYLFEDSINLCNEALAHSREVLKNKSLFATLAVKYNFHKYLLMFSSDLHRCIDGFVHNINDCKSSIADLKSSQEKGKEEEISGNDNQLYKDRMCTFWKHFINENEANNQEDIEVPSAMSDIFEAVAGAIYLDSGMSLDSVWEIYYPMMKLEIDYFRCNSLINSFQVLEAKYKNMIEVSELDYTLNGKSGICIKVHDIGNFVGFGENKLENAAKQAIAALQVVEINLS